MLIRLVMALGVKVSVLPRLLEVVGSSSTFDDIEGMWLLGVRQYGLARSSELIKRASDVDPGRRSARRTRSAAPDLTVANQG